jgi:hypothetical protein
MHIIIILAGTKNIHYGLIGNYSRVFIINKMYLGLREFMNPIELK